MKIDSSLGIPNAMPNNESKVARSNVPQQAAAKPESRDEVQLSSTSQLLSMGGLNDSTPPMDSSKVEAIKQAISEGRFKINPEMIADSLLNSVRDSLANHKSLG